MDKREKIKRITASIFGAVSSRQISIDLGNVVSQQQAASYARGASLPDPTTCVEIIKSPRATTKAKAWARACLAVVLPDVTVTVSEPEQVS